MPPESPENEKRIAAARALREDIRRASEELFEDDAESGIEITRHAFARILENALPQYRPSPRSKKKAKLKKPQRRFLQETYERLQNYHEILISEKDLRPHLPKILVYLDETLKIFQSIMPDKLIPEYISILEKQLKEFVMLFLSRIKKKKTSNFSNLELQEFKQFFQQIFQTIDTLVRVYDIRVDQIVENWGEDIED